MIQPNQMRTAACSFLLTLTLGSRLVNGQTSPSAPAPALKETVEQIVRDYIMQHPDVVMDSLRGMQERSRAAEALKARDAISGKKEELGGDALTPVAGNPSSDVAMTFFFDYRCGYCKKVTADLMPFTKADSPVRVIFKEFPILGPESEFASRAALAAARQKVYLPFHQALMQHQGAFTPEGLEEIARGLKLDIAKWKSDMAAPEVDQAIRANQALAASVGIQATPSFVAGTELAPGALDLQGFRSLIDRAKAEAAKRTVAAASK